MINLLKSKNQQGGSARWVLWVVTLVLALLIFGLWKNSAPQPRGQQTGNLTKEQAVLKVRAQSEVLDFLRQVPQARVEIGGEEDSVYLVQVFEVKDGHTATFNWYKVNKTTGDLEKTFE